MDSTPDPRVAAPSTTIPGFRGRVLGSADPEFEGARRVANGVIDRHPDIKRRYDPDNVFRSNHNVPPA